MRLPCIQMMCYNILAYNKKVKWTWFTWSRMYSKRNKRVTKLLTKYRCYISVRLCKKILFHNLRKSDGFSQNINIKSLLVEETMKEKSNLNWLLLHVLSRVSPCPEYHNSCYLFIYIFNEVAYKYIIYKEKYLVDLNMKSTKKQMLYNNYMDRQDFSNIMKTVFTAR